MKQKTIGIISLMTAMLFAFATTAWAGDFIIQSPVGTDIFIVDNATGNVNVSTGFIYEANVRLGTIYWNTTDVATPSDGDTTHVSTADQIFDYIAGLGYKANAWDNLSSMNLTDTYIFVGNSSNSPAGVAVSGDITIDNAGVVAVLDSSHVHAGENITSGTVAETYIDALIARDTEVVTANTSVVSYINTLNMTGNVTGIITDAKFCTYNATNHLINCDSDAAGISNVVEDVTPQLGGNLDVNDFGIDGGGLTNMTIDATGNFIIVLG